VIWPFRDGLKQFIRADYGSGKPFPCPVFAFRNYRALPEYLECGFGKQAGIVRFSFLECGVTTPLWIAATRRSAKKNIG